VSRRSDRLTAQITGKAREVGPEEAHARAVLAITRRIHTREARRRRLQAELKKLAGDLRADRLELRAVLQRDSSITVDDPRLDLAGKADAIDAVQARVERRPADAVEQIQQEAYAAFGAENDGVLPEVDELRDPFSGAGKDGGQ
jgi:hypothetical protein